MPTRKDTIRSGCPARSARGTPSLLDSTLNFKKSSNENIQHIIGSRRGFKRGWVQAIPWGRPHEADCYQNGGSTGCPGKQRHTIRGGRNAGNGGHKRLRRV